MTRWSPIRRLAHQAGRRPELPDPALLRMVQQLRTDEPGGITEADLFVGYRHAHEPLERPVSPLIDESGLVYGEPISKGRTARWRIIP